MLTSTRHAMRTTSGPPVVPTDFLLVSDLDGTLIPSTPDDDERSIACLTHLVRTRRSLVLAYATGRHLDLALQGIRQHRLPLPGFLICDVGTRIYRRDGDAYGEDPGYAAALAPECETALFVRVRKNLEALPGVQAQEDAKQGRYKASFYVAPDVGEQEIFGRVVQCLGKTSDSFRSVYSIDPVDGRGLLDLIPASLSKASATGYLQGLLRLSKDDVLYAGDSGNDTDALLEGFRGVLVGNAPDSLRRRLREEAERAGLAGRLYFAAAPYAAGVIEGCRHFGLL